MDALTSHRFIFRRHTRAHDRGVTVLWMSMPRWLRVLAVTGVAGLALVVALQLAAPQASATPTLVDLLDYPALAFTFAAALLGHRRTVGATRTSWGLVALAIALWIVGEVTWDVRVVALHGSTGPSVSDLFWLLFYPPLLAAFFVRGRDSRPRMRDLSMIDALIVTVAAAVLAWEFIVRGSLAADNSSTVQQILNIAYPAFDLGLLWLLATSAYPRSGRLPLPHKLLTAGLAGVLIADFTWLLTESPLYGAISAAALMLVGVAAPIETRQPQPPEGEAPRRREGAVLPLTLLASIVMLGAVATRIAHGPVDPLTAAGLLVLFVLFTARLLLTLRQNQRLLALTEARAITDPLTELANHGYFDDRLDQELLRSQRGGQPLTLVMIDIDEFKAINDLAGHKAGDRVLREVGMRLRRACRAGDVACRVGGDELAVIAPDTDLEGAARLAERLHRTLGEIAIPELGVDTRVSVSVGCSVYPTRATTRAALVDQTDAALYDVKRQGRNGWSMFDPTADGATSASEELALVRNQLAASESDFSAVFTHALDPMVIHDALGVILDGNLASERMLGIPRDQITGRTIFDFTDPGNHAQVESLLATAVANNEQRGQLELLLPDGSLRDVEFASARFSPDRFLVSMRDVSERVRTQAQLRLSEQRFKALFEEATDAMFVTGDDGTVKDVNAAGCALAGRSRGELVGAPVESLVEPERAAEIGAVGNRLAAGSGRELGTFTGRGWDGRRHTYEYSVVADFMPGEHLSIVRDISSRCAETDGSAAELAEH